MPANVPARYVPGGAIQPGNLGRPPSFQQNSSHTVEGGAMSPIPWALSTEEKAKCDKIFKDLDPQGTGYISGEIGAAFFSQSRLSEDDLANIWDLADTRCRGSLDLAEFRIAMGLTTRKLNGEPIPAELPPALRSSSRTSADLTIAASPKTTVAGFPRYDWTSMIRGVVSPIPWWLSTEEKAKYDETFKDLDLQGTGYMSGETGAQFFAQSGLSDDDLADIWDLADTRPRGSLDLAEFRVAMGLIFRRLNGKPIPAKLPPTLTSSSQDLGAFGDISSKNDGLELSLSRLNVDDTFPFDVTSQISRNDNNPVASGGFADIYSATLYVNGSPLKVAVKAIKTYSAEDTSFQKKSKRLRREMKVWSNLDHINVLPFFGMTMGFGRFPAMVCPWIEGGTLTSFLGSHESLTIKERLTLLRDVAAGLQYLHSQSVVHGDLSGSNVLIDDDNLARISDFGLSTLLTEMGGTTFATSSRAGGTLRWAAPELLYLNVSVSDDADEPPIILPTPHSDIYSFGGVMFQILTGKIPYHYYSRDERVLLALSQGETPKRPRSELVTDNQWHHMQWCWSTTDAGVLRPTAEQVHSFVTHELHDLRHPNRNSVAVGRAVLRR